MEPNNHNGTYANGLSAQRLWQLTHLYERRRSGVTERQIPTPEELDGLARLLTLPENKELAMYGFGLFNGALSKGIPAIRSCLEAELRRYLQPETPIRTEPLL